MHKSETTPGAWGLLAGLLVLLFGVFEACDVPMKTRPRPDAAVHHVTASERPAGMTAASVMQRQLDAIAHMRVDYPAVEATVMFWPCGEENGYYYPLEDRIELCTEDIEHPDWAVQVAMHEFGHAVTNRYASVLDENAADEIAIIEMVRWGYLDEMLGAGMYMAVNWPQDHVDGDGHPGGAYRAWELFCAESAAEARKDPTRPASRECVRLLDGLEVKWDARIPRLSTMK